MSAAASRLSSPLSLLTGGSLPGITRVVSVQIYDHVEALQYGAAHQLAAVLLILAFVLLLALYAWRPRASVLRG